MTRRLLDAIERHHRRKTIRWNATHPRPCVTTKPRRKP